MPRQPGDKLGPTKSSRLRERRHGRGVVGAGFQAGCEVAIKILPSALAQDPEHLAHFEREDKILARWIIRISRESTPSKNPRGMRFGHGPGSGRDAPGTVPAGNKSEQEKGRALDSSRLAKRVAGYDQSSPLGGGSVRFWSAVSAAAASGGGEPRECALA